MKYKNKSPRTLFRAKSSTINHMINFNFKVANVNKDMREASIESKIRLNHYILDICLIGKVLCIFHEIMDR